MVLDVVNYLVVPCDKSAKGSEGLAESPHDQVHVVGHAVVCRGAATSAQDAQAVSVIHHQAGAVFLGNLQHVRKRRYVTSHAENAVGHHYSSRILRHFLQHSFQVFHIPVAETEHLAAAQHTAVHDAGMVVFVGDDIISFSYEGRDGPQIGLVARAERQGRLLADELRQLFFQLHVKR